jgi:UDP-N-acetylmuramate dehydrogenase
MSAVEQAAALLGPLAEHDVPLAPLTTYRVGGAAALFIRPASLDQLHVLARAVAETGVPVLVVGRGSNLLVADEGFAGIAVSLSAFDAGIAIEHTTVTAGGAVALPVLARRTVSAALTGFEWAVGVPGSVGGGVRMNAGGHGSDMAASLSTVQLFDLRRDEVVVVPSSELGLRFRGSDIGIHQIVLSATLQLRPGVITESEAELDEVVRWRREHQPGGQNAGSVFVNPVPGEITAGALIDHVGLRGFRMRTAYVSDKHANFIQGTEGGSARDVHDLIELVRRVVAERTGHLLRSEVQLVGFDNVDPPHDDHAGVNW